VHAGQDVYSSCLSTEVAITTYCVSPARRHCGLTTESINLNLNLKTTYNRSLIYFIQ